MKKTILSIALALAAAGAGAAPRTADQALAIARRFVIETHHFQNVRSANLSLAPTSAAQMARSLQSSTPSYYICNVENGGFVVVSGDDRFKEILGYSTNGTYDADNLPDGFAYWIAGLYRGGEVPDGLELFTFPESDWAIFSAKGALPMSLQTLNAQVWNEWAPNIRKMYETGTSFLEIYSAMNPRSPDYECGIWVPIRKKAELRICQSCGMPMETEDVFGTNADGSINEDYCKYCYVSGEFIDKVSMEEYIEMCSRFGSQAGMTNEEMKAYCENLFPMLKRWKK